MNESTRLPKVKYEEWYDMTYQEAWQRQTDIHNDLKSNKLEWRHLSEEKRVKKRQLHRLIFCEHSHVYTLGKSGSIDHLLLDEKQLLDRSIEYYKINRGGDITYHGPGQITGYPLLDMDEFYNDIHKYVRMIESCIITLLTEYGIDGDRIEGYTGVWIRSDDLTLRPHRKICAIGVHMSRWVTMHGFALNVNTDLSLFDNIVPCGIEDKDKEVTSIEKELGRKMDMQEVKRKLKSIFAAEFNFEYQE